MSEVTLKSQAEKIAARVDASAVGFDPITIITIITQVLPLIMQCFARNDEPNPAQVSAEVRAQNARAPKQLRKRTARRIRGDADQPMTREESFALAEAVIAEACEAEPETVSALCASVEEFE